AERWTLTTDDATQRTAAAAALEKYTAEAANVLHMATGDPVTAFVILLSVEKAFGRVKEQLDALRDIQARQSDQTSVAAFKSESEARVLFLVLFGAALLLAGVVTVTVSRMISRPIAGMTRAMAALASGDQSVEIPGTDRDDEIGRMAEAAQVFETNMVEGERLRIEQAHAEKSAAMERRAAEERENALKKKADERSAAERKATMHQLADAFEKAIGNIAVTVSSASTELEAAADTLTKAANVTQQLSASAAAASEQASGNV